MGGPDKMICLRCGYCCINYPVAILSNPDKNNKIEFKSGDITCKHLIGETPGEFSCKIHNNKQYKKTPCYSHAQFERKNSNCRLGEYFLQNKGKYKWMQNSRPENLLSNTQK